jgi:hypothetical protein
LEISQDKSLTIRQWWCGRESGCAALGLDSSIPIRLVKSDLRRIQFSVKTTTNLRFTMAIETKHSQILDHTVRRVVVDVMDLNGS